MNVKNGLEHVLSSGEMFLFSELVDVGSLNTVLLWVSGRDPAWV
jgi:hypothetical protein